MVGKSSLRVLHAPNRDFFGQILGSVRAPLSKPIPVLRCDQTTSPTPRLIGSANNADRIESEQRHLPSWLPGTTDAMGPCNQWCADPTPQFLLTGGWPIRRKYFRYLPIWIGLSCEAILNVQILSASTVKVIFYRRIMQMKVWRYASFQYSSNRKFSGKSCDSISAHSPFSVQKLDFVVILSV